MDFMQILLLVILAFFGVISINQDIKSRKVKNSIVMSFLAIAFVVFVSYSIRLTWLDYIMIFLTIGLSFYVYWKGIWGAADGKVLIGIGLIIVSFGKSDMLLRFAVNLVFFYALTITIVALVKTSLKDKDDVFLKIDFLESAFLILVVFTFVGILFSVLDLDLSSPFVMIMVFIVILFSIDKIRRLVRPYYHSLNLDMRLILLAIFFIMFFFYHGGFMFLHLFVIIFVVKNFITFISNLTDKLKLGRKKYESPYVLYLFFSAFVTLLTNASFLEVILRLFL